MVLIRLSGCCCCPIPLNRAHSRRDRRWLALSFPRPALLTCSIHLSTTITLLLPLTSLGLSWFCFHLPVPAVILFFTKEKPSAPLDLLPRLLVSTSMQPVNRKTKVSWSTRTMIGQLGCQDYLEVARTVRRPEPKEHET